MVYTILRYAVRVVQYYAFHRMDNLVIISQLHDYLDRKRVRLMHTIVFGIWACVENRKSFRLQMDKRMENRSNHINRRFEQ